MESLLAESPILSSLMLAVLAFGLLYAWLQTGKKPVAFGGLACLALIPVAWLVADRWETDREQIEDRIYEIADAVEANDHDTAVSIIADSATRVQAKNELSRYVFELADVNKIRSIELITDTFPIEADVDMSVKVDVRQVNGGQSFRVPRRLLLRFVKEGDVWMVSDYQHMPITGGPDQFTTQPIVAP